MKILRNIKFFLSHSEARTLSLSPPTLLLYGGILWRLKLLTGVMETLFFYNLHEFGTAALFFTIKLIIYVGSFNREKERILPLGPN